MRPAALLQGTLGVATLALMAAYALVDSPTTMWLFVLVTLGIVATAIVLTRGAQPYGQRDQWTYWAVSTLILFPLAVGSVAVAGVLDPTLASLEEARQEDRERHVADSWQAIIDEQGRELQALQAFFESTKVTSASFQTFVGQAGWEFGPGRSTAIGYAPIIAHADVDAFEQSVRQDEELPDAVREGFSVFWGIDEETGAPFRGDAAFYTPVRHVYPMDPAPGAIGFDLSVDPAQATALQTAGSTGALAASAPAEIVKPDGNAWGMMVALPVEQEGAVVGYVISALAVPDATVAPPAPDATEYRVVDVTGDELELYATTQETEWVHSTHLSAWGRDWRIDIATASTLTLTEASAPFGILFSGGLLSMAIGLVAYAYDSSRERAVQLSEEMLDHVRHEQRRRAKLQRLEELDAFRTRFMNMATHELRTPLTPIRSQLYLLRKAGGEELTRSLDILERGVDRLNNMVDDMLLSAKADAGSLKLRLVDHDLADLAREAVDAHHDAAEAVGTKIQLDAPSVHARVDRDRMSAILDNLLTNAIKFTPNGRINVRVGIDGGPYITVSDNGEGIDPDDLHLVGQPFAQVQDHALGTGLGVYICKQLAELHGGRLEIASEGLGKGATFTVRLPAYAV